MPQRIVSRFPDIELWCVETLRESLPENVKIGRRKSKTVSDYQEVVVQAIPGVMLTPVTRQVLINLDCYAVDDSGNHVSASAHELASDAAFALQIAQSNPFTDVGINAGPYFEIDEESKVEYSLVTLAADVIRI